ncbi:MAG: MGMT family protein [Candidatus Omnitrophota bacterium]|nr:MGMT family protein [Candidatus Omnitrophota bacterium]
MTQFEWKVLEAALTIPFGQTRSYGWVAQKIGRPRAMRAVGQALRKNPYPIAIPCHRVIRSDGTPGGYAGRMGPQKGRLLALEQAVLRRLRNPSTG